MKNVNDFKIGVIYRYISPNGKCYIGQTIDESSRKSSHKRKTALTKTHFGAALRKYGYENFKYEILIKFKPTLDKKRLKRVLNKLEIRYIKLFDSINSGYNLMTGGDSSIHSPESIEKITQYQQNRTEEHKKKLSKAALNQVKSQETKNKMSNTKNHLKKKVLQYDLENNLLNTFDSIADAARSIDKKTSSATQKTKSNRISECCKEERLSIFGFFWKFNCEK